MRNIVKGAVMLAALTMMFRKKGGFRRRREAGRGMWRTTPPNPDSFDNYGDLK